MMTPRFLALTTSGWICHSLIELLLEKKANLGERPMVSCRNLCDIQVDVSPDKWMNASGIQERSGLGTHQRICYKRRDEMT